ncbi:Hypothetical predicted protein [Paramuricea clavata]|uniref:Uncharacterized protein n=1 Tax=Paramuricea clavata TaxID=317549 RepID=A0A6S7GHZ7_PARCT|nr:Hypothetical predicted protein [Paramuricea clavata]
MSYLDNRYGCFFSDEAILDYEDLLDRIKTAVPYIQSIPSERIRIAYKDVTLSSGAGQNEGVFINILPGNPMVLGEAFRNAYDCGAESFKRIEIKLREVDSPYVAKMKKQNTNTTAASRYNTTEQQSSKELFPETKQDWKISKLEDMSDHAQQLQDELVAVDIQLEELRRPVIEPPQLGQYKSIVCGKCHIRGHRAEGNRHNAACMREVCTSYYTCGQNKKHPEHFEQIRNLTKKRKQLNSEVETLSTNKRSLEAFQSKSVSAFVTTITPRLLKAFPDRYNTTTTSGKILLQKDLATLRIACNNKIPIPSMNEREYFTELLENQQKLVTASDLNFDARAASTSQININTHISSPVSEKAKRHKTKTVAMPVEISSSDDHSTDSSDTSSDDSESFDEGKRSKSRRTKKHRRKYKRHDHWGKKKRSYRLQKVSNEYTGNENFKIDNSQEKQTVSINQSTNNRRLLPYSNILQGAIPSDFGIFEIGESNSHQLEYGTSTKKDRQSEQNFVTDYSTSTLDDLANAAEQIDNRTCFTID